MLNSRPRHIGFVAALLLVSLTRVDAAHADEVADFYRGRTIRVVIGYGPAGGYDIYGRLAAEFLGRHIPGQPTVIAVNMPGGGSLKAIEFLAQVAPPDGTHLGVVAQQMAMNALVTGKNTADVARLPYLGRLAPNIDLGVALRRTGIVSFEDVRQREVLLGADQSASMAAVYARALNAYAGARFRMVKGYKGSADVQLAAERGEVDVNGSISFTALSRMRPELARDSQIAILYQNALERLAALPEVPTLLELAAGEEGRAIMRVIAGTAELGRSILTTPGVPPERLTALRVAFEAMLKDPQFLAATAKRRLMVAAASGETLDAITRDTLSLPAATVEALKRVLQD